MGMVLATLFIIYGPLLIVYRLSRADLITSEDATASLALTLFGLYIILSLAIGYEDAALGKHRGNMSLVQRVNVPSDSRYDSVDLGLSLDSSVPMDASDLLCSGDAETEASCCCH